MGRDGGFGQRDASRKFHPLSQPLGASRLRSEVGDELVYLGEVVLIYLRSWTVLLRLGWAGGGIRRRRRVGEGRGGVGGILGGRVKEVKSGLESMRGSPQMELARRKT